MTPKEEMALNANLIILRIQIDALKNILDNEQKTKFNNEVYSKQLEILSTYVDNELLSKTDFEELFRKALIEL